MNNEIFSHPGQPQLQAEVILASSTDNSPKIYTIRARVPRVIWAEIMTHRVFSRNARSSRAVPVKTMLNEVRTIPYVPWHWGANQAGMQADEECNTRINISRDWPITNREAWLRAANFAADTAEAFMKAGYHKQNPNRLLEPFSWIDALITTTDIDNFLWLRDHEDAEPHLQDFARLVDQAVQTCPLQHLEPGQWHLPYVTEDDKAEVIGRTAGLVMTPGDMRARRLSALLQICSARCARISYAPFGESLPNLDKDFQVYSKLVGNSRIHASPMEHQATPDAPKFQGNEYSQPHLHGNLTGWVQYRKTIPGEHFKAAKAA